jgi:uncharacterized membrane protein YeaQ/YmgE (transglycosylase-associated protein family)
MGLLSWVIFGAIAGWVASLLTGRNSRMGCLANIVIGVAGAFVGGFLVNFLGGEGVVTGFNIRSFGVAILGAVILLVVTGWFSRRRR